MITRHFLKTLIVFTGMIVVGLIGIFAVSYLEKNSKANVADGEPCKIGILC